MYRSPHLTSPHLTLIPERNAYLLVHITIYPSIKPNQARRARISISIHLLKNAGSARPSDALEILGRSNK